jgi:DNA-binding transcriptional regulator YdaS (Cro superfamily)
MPSLAAICRRCGTTLVKLAPLIGRSYPTIRKWGRPGRPIPVEMVPAICRALGDGVAWADLRPDIFGATPAPPGADTPSEAA